MGEVISLLFEMAEICLCIEGTSTSCKRTLVKLTCHLWLLMRGQPFLRAAKWALFDNVYVCVSVGPKNVLEFHNLCRIVREGSKAPCAK